MEDDILEALQPEQIVLQTRPAGIPPAIRGSTSCSAETVFNTYLEKFGEYVMMLCSLLATPYRRYHAEPERMRDRRHVIIVFLIELLERLRNGTLISHLQICFAAFLFVKGCPKPVWQVLRFLRLVPGKDTLLAHARAAPNRAALDGAETIVVTADNCEYYMRVSYGTQHRVPRLINTVNILYTMISIPSTDAVWMQRTLKQPETRSVAFYNWGNMLKFAGLAWAQCTSPADEHRRPDLPVPGQVPDCK